MLAWFEKDKQFEYFSVFYASLLFFCFFYENERTNNLVRCRPANRSGRTEVGRAATSKGEPAASGTISQHHQQSLLRRALCGSISPPPPLSLLFSHPPIFIVRLLFLCFSLFRHSLVLSLCYTLLSLTLLPLASFSIVLSLIHPFVIPSFMILSHSSVTSSSIVLTLILSSIIFPPLFSLLRHPSTPLCIILSRSLLSPFSIVPSPSFSLSLAPSHLVFSSAIRLPNCPVVSSLSAASSLTFLLRDLSIVFPLSHSFVISSFIVLSLRDLPKHRAYCFSLAPSCSVSHFRPAWESFLHLQVVRDHSHRFVHPTPLPFFLRAFISLLFSSPLIISLSLSLSYVLPPFLSWFSFWFDETFTFSSSIILRRVVSSYLLSQKLSLSFSLALPSLESSSLLPSRTLASHPNLSISLAPSSLFATIPPSFGFRLLFIPPRPTSLSLFP